MNHLLNTPLEWLKTAKRAGLTMMELQALEVAAMANITNVIQLRDAIVKHKICSKASAFKCIDKLRDLAYITTLKADKYSDQRSKLVTVSGKGLKLLGR